jgi:hypothetical protein
MFKQLILIGFLLGISAFALAGINPRTSQGPATAITEIGGATLPIGSVVDGEFLKRVGVAIVSASAGGSSGVDATGLLTAASLDIDGKVLYLDADGDSYVVAATDDKIDVYVNGVLTYFLTTTELSAPNINLVGSGERTIYIHDLSLDPNTTISGLTDEIRVTVGGDISYFKKGSDSFLQLPGGYDLQWPNLSSVTSNSDGNVIVTNAAETGGFCMNPVAYLGNVLFAAFDNCAASAGVAALKFVVAGDSLGDDYYTRYPGMDDTLAGVAGGEIAFSAWEGDPATADYDKFSVGGVGSSWELGWLQSSSMSSAVNGKIVTGDNNLVNATCSDYTTSGAIRLYAKNCASASTFTADTLIAPVGLTPPKYTGDPCGTIGEGAIFYNDTSNFMCYCSGSVDKKMSDDTDCF